MKNLSGEHKGGNGLDVCSKRLCEYFWENEAKMYPEDYVNETKRKFVKWGMDMVKQGHCYELFNNYLFTK